MNNSRPFEPEDLLLYAMQLLGADESAAIAAHLKRDPILREELAKMQGDLSTFAFTTEMHSPPAPARARFMKAVARERKAPPMLRPITPPLQLQQGAAQPVAQVKPEEAEAVAPSIGAYQRNSGGGQLFSFEADENAEPKRGVVRTISPWIGWAVAAGLAVTSVQYYRESESLRGEVASDKAQIDQNAAEAASAREVLNAMNDQTAMKVTLRKPFAPVTPMGRTTYSSSKGVLIFTATNLEPIDTFKVYQLWIIPSDGKAPIPAGTFHPDAQGYANFVLTNLPKGVEAKAFGITVENEGGAKTPTPPILMTGA